MQTGVLSCKTLGAVMRTSVLCCRASPFVMRQREVVWQTAAVALQTRDFVVRAGVFVWHAELVVMQTASRDAQCWVFARPPALPEVTPAGAGALTPNGMRRIAFAPKSFSLRALRPEVRALRAPSGAMPSSGAVGSVPANPGHPGGLPSCARCARGVCVARRAHSSSSVAGVWGSKS
jgi:hypothetical protein